MVGTLAAIAPPVDTPRLTCWSIHVEGSSNIIVDINYQEVPFEAIAVSPTAAFPRQIIIGTDLLINCNAVIEFPIVLCRPDQTTHLLIVQERLTYITSIKVVLYYNVVVKAPCSRLAAESILLKRARIYKSLALVAEEARGSMKIEYGQMPRNVIKNASKTPDYFPWHKVDHLLFLT